ncbi:MAG TPA: proline dehydrogenase, partial [Actinoplanes sp.]
ADGNIVRVYLPYGPQWFGYLLRRLAERPGPSAFIRKK